MTHTKSDLVEAFDMAHSLIQEAKPRQGFITDHLDAAECWIDKAQEMALAAWDIRTEAIEAGAVAELIEAARGFVAQVEMIHDHPQYQNVWRLNHIRSGAYTGPQYADELEALSNALAKFAPANMGDAS